MRFLVKLRLRMQSLFRRRRVEQELDDELHFHIERETEANIARGMSREEARYAALRSTGGVAQIQEECRDTRRLRWLEDLLQDTRYAFRVFRQHPGFTFTAIASLAIGIGANTAMFSLIDAALLRSLPVRNPEQLMLLVQRSGSQEIASFSVREFTTFRDSADTLSGLCAFRPRPATPVVNGGGEPQLVFTQLVSGDCYSMLGIHPALGRLISKEDDRALGGSPVAVLGWDYWQREFAGDPAAVGRVITMRGQPFTIIGVTPREFFGLEPGKAVNITVPLTMQPALMPAPIFAPNSNARWLRLLGRAKPGMTADHVRADLAVKWARLAADQGQKRPDSGLDVRSGAQGLNELRERFSQPLRALMIVVGLVLLIACANLASLLLARSTGRQREIAVRMAMGARRGRLIRQLVTESILLALLGGGAALLLARWGTGALLRIMAVGTSPIALDLTPDARVLGFTLAVSLVAGLLFGLAPALRATTVEIGEKLSGAARGIAGGGNRLGQTMITVQVALSFTLLTGAGMLLLSLRNLYHVDAGFSASNVLLYGVNPGLARFDNARQMSLYRDLYQRFNAIPGVEAASFSLDTPMGGLSYSAGINVPGRIAEKGEQVYYNFVGPKFFEALRIPILRGRDFRADDRDPSRRIAAVNESLARHYFPNSDAVGRRVEIDGKPVEIVALVRDAKYTGLRDKAPEMIYQPFLQGEPMGGVTFSVRSGLDRSAVIEACRREMRAAAPELPIAAASTLEQQIDATLVQERMVSTLSLFFAVVALGLAAIGLYGTLAYAVTRRTREIGVRMALGGRRARIAALLVAESLRPVTAGIAFGIPLAMWGGRLVARLLFGVTPAAGSAYALAALALALATTAALLIPVRRATRIDPASALRHE